MAINNPINPTNDPNYVNSTRPISIPDDIKPQGVDTNRIMPRGQEIGDRSAEFEGRAKGAASQAQGMSSLAFSDLFSGIAATGDFLGKAGVQMVKKNIENEVYDIASAERDRYTQILQSIRDGKSVKDILAGGGSTDTPSDIRDLPDQLSVLKSAKDGGKLRSTDYRARLAALAKDLRAKYPGFRAEIDEEFRKVTGMNPANSVITGLIADINAQGHSVNTEQNKAISFILSHEGDFDNAAEAIQKVQTGEWGLTDVVNQSAPRARMRATIADRKAVFEDSKLTDEQKSIAGVKLIDTVADYAADNFITKFTKQMGLETDAQAETMAIRTKSGELSSQRWQELGQLYARGAIDLRENMWAEARKHGLVNAVGSKEVEERINIAMHRVEALKDRIYAADVGGIHNAAKMVQAMKDDDVRNAMTDDIIGGATRVAMLARSIGGDQFAAAEGLRQATDGLIGKWGAYGKSMQDAILAQKDMKTTGVPLTLNRVFDAYSDKMKNATAKEKAVVINSTINQILRIADPKTPEAAKVNFALAAFSPDRRSFITRLNQDSYDAKNRPTRGQNAVFQDMSSEAMTNAMYELGKKYPQLWERYTNWVTETLGNDLMSRDARYLDQIRNPAIKVGWDSDNHRFKFEYSISDTERNRLHITRLEEDAEGVHVRNIVHRLNNNMAGFKHIAKVTGADVDAYVLGTIAKAVGPKSLSRVDGIPANIIRDIGLSKLKKKEK